MLTPIRKSQFRDRLDREKEFNKQVGRIRYRIEQAIANPKLGESSTSITAARSQAFAETISAVIALEFYRIHCE